MFTESNLYMNQFLSVMDNLHLPLFSWSVEYIINKVETEGET